MQYIALTNSIEFPPVPSTHAILSTTFCWAPAQLPCCAPSPVVPRRNHPVKHLWCHQNPLQLVWCAPSLCCAPSQNLVWTPYRLSPQAGQRIGTPNGHCDKTNTVSFNSRVHRQVAPRVLWPQTSRPDFHTKLCSKLTVRCPEVNWCMWCASRATVITLYCFKVHVSYLQIKVIHLCNCPGKCACFTCVVKVVKMNVYD